MAITLSIMGMTCHHCVHALTKAIQAVSGVDTVSVNLESGLALVEGKAEAGSLIQAGWRKKGTRHRL